MLALWFTSHHDPPSRYRTMSLSSFSITADWSCLRRYFAWWLRTDHPINSSFAKSGGALVVRWFEKGMFPNLVYITSGFRRKRFGVYALKVLLIPIYAIRWHARWRFVIFGCRIIPIHGSRYRAMRPCSYSLDSAVVRLCNAVTFWYISTPVSYLYVQFVCESE